MSRKGNLRLVRSKRAGLIARRHEQMAEAETVVGQFVCRFAFFESVLSEALRALSADSHVVDYLPELMDLHYRLKLLRYLGADCGLPAALFTELKRTCDAADELRKYRDWFAHGLTGLSSPFLTGPEARNVVGGAHKPRSKWKLSGEHGCARDALSALHREAFVTVPKIRECTEASDRLALAMQQLANKLGCFMRGEDWERIEVFKVAVPKL